MLSQLRQQLQKTRPASLMVQTVETGLKVLDDILPGHGFSTGSVVEWISDQPGMFAGSIALSCIRPFLKMSGCLAVIDSHGEFYLPAAVARGIPASRILLVRPDHPSDSLWALEQASLSAGVRVVLCWLDRVSSTVMRRLQLAVERSGVTVFLIRPAQVLQQPSWADLRLTLTTGRPVAVEPSSDMIDHQLITVRLVRSRHTIRPTNPAILKIDHETGAVHSVCQLADSAAAPKR